MPATSIGAKTISRQRPPVRRLLLIAALLASSATSAVSHGNDIELPTLGDTTSALISPQQEFELGRAWLGAFRSRVKTLDDPELQVYLEGLIYELARYSELSQPQLELVIINNPTLNAFAVPGGVVGVHTGLFQYAETEHQMASVLAHELAHLSQRHFARSLQNSKSSSVATMAGLLTGIILAATVGGDAGIAAMTMTQAAALENSLRYSRQNEQEADRMGIKTLYESGRDPSATSAMFEKMMAATRYTGQRPPEFLLTHPLTEKRVADAQNRVHSYPTRQYPLKPDYYFMRARAQLWIDSNPQKSIQRFSNELDGYTSSVSASRYGLALAQSRNSQDKLAWKTFAPLLKAEPNNLTIQLAALELEFNRSDYDDALIRIGKLEPLHGTNYALQRYKAEALLKVGKNQDAERLLADLTKQRPNDPEVWFELAEISGLAGNIVAVHKARAEYFVLIGVYDKAIEQLTYAKRLVGDDYRENALLDTRLEDVKKMMEKVKQL